MKNNLLHKSTSPYNSPVVLVKKKDNTYRFTVNYRKLNAITQPMYFPIPNLEEVFDTIGAAKPTIWSLLDRSGLLAY